jgi:hypothetical protein
MNSLNLITMLTIASFALVWGVYGKLLIVKDLQMNLKELGKGIRYCVLKFTFVLNPCLNFIVYF